MNLAQFPEPLLESELFGHRKGAFTGAVEAHEGVFAGCSPFGAIFLDAPAARCLERNRSREDSVPERVISNLQAEKELPDVAEGYKEVMVVTGY